MSEQVRKQTVEQLPSGQHDLSDLSASKDLHKKQTAQPANAPDLASVSISSSSFVRSSSHARQPHSGINQSSTQSISEGPSIIRQGRSNSKAQNRGHGIFKNPTYPYQGGFASKIITFLANVLKVLERLFLRLLGARDTVAPPPTQQSGQPTKPDQKASRAKRDTESEHAPQLIHRS